MITMTTCRSLLKNILQIDLGPGQWSVSVLINIAESTTNIMVITDHDISYLV